jgi:hypothetical protein
MLIGAGWLLIASGVLHVPVWLLDGSEWEGSVSWRKPILFGVSTGMTLWSLGWIVGAMKLGRLANVDRVLSYATTVALVVEVALITLQQWRATPSHFNSETELDRWIDLAMFVLICIAFLGILYFGFRSLGDLRLDDDYAIAARSGMLCLVVSCVIGFVISAYGYERVRAGLEPETFGKSGVTKFPHGIAIHVLQILPAVVFLLRKFDSEPELRRRFVWHLSVTFMSLLIFACVQTLNGQDRFELNSPLAIILLSVSAIAATIPLVEVALAMLWKTSDKH